MASRDKRMRRVLGAEGLANRVAKKAKEKESTLGTQDKRTRRALGAEETAKSAEEELILDVERCIAEQRDYASILKWLSGCLGTHSVCYKPSKTASLPKRLIDVGPSDGTVEPRLTETSDMAEDTELPRYLTLSYCWGEPDVNRPFLRTTTDSLPSRQHAIPKASMPRTFQDAVDVARGLGVRHIWIDALCIVQDVMEDWVSESSRMEHIYRNALCCLVATHAPNPHVGLFIGQIKDPEIAIRPARSFSISPDGSCFRDAEPADRAISNGAVSKRAWCLQERYLSPRLLHFTGMGLLKECNHGLESEATRVCLPPLRGCARSTQHAGILIPENSDTVFFRLRYDWYNVVHEYRSRTLTRSSDVLSALSGLAREVARATSDSYLAGLWRSNLHIGLSWWVLRNSTASRPAEYRAPSWSWASTDGRLAWHMAAFHERTMAVTTVIDAMAAEMLPLGSGFLEGAVLLLSGPLKPLGTSKTLDVARLALPETARTSINTPGIPLWDDDQEMASSRGDSVFWLVLWIMEGHPVNKVSAGGLLLVRDYDHGHEDYVYRRVGYMTDQATSFDEIETKCIILV